MARAEPLPDGAPAGFATRVLAQWREAETRDWTLWLLPRAVGVAAMVAAGVLALEAARSGADEGELASWVVNSALELEEQP